MFSLLTFLYSLWFGVGWLVVCLHYVGSNTDRFRIRLNDYKENNRKTKIAVLLLLTKQVRLILLEERNTGEEF